MRERRLRVKKSIRANMRFRLEINAREVHFISMNRPTFVFLRRNFTVDSDCSALRRFSTVQRRHFPFFLRDEGNCLIALAGVSKGVCSTFFCGATEKQFKPEGDMAMNPRAAARKRRRAFCTSSFFARKRRRAFFLFHQENRQMFFRSVETDFFVKIADRADGRRMSRIRECSRRLMKRRTNSFFFEILLAFPRRF